MASALVRINEFRNFSSKKASSFIVLGCITIAVAAFPSAYGLVPLILLSISFSLIAGGNNIFGVLSSPASRTMGETAYSIYLLHGIILFVIFTFVIGKDNAKNYSAIEHWILIISATPPLIFFSFFTFRFIENPAMQKTNSVTAWLRSRLAPRDKAGSRPDL